MESWIAGPYISDVAFEMLHIDRIEADDGGVQPDIRLGDVLPKIERYGVLGQMLLGAVEGGE